MKEKLTGYELSRAWFNFSFEDAQTKPVHTALFMWVIELNNRLGWKSEFGLPTYSTMEGLGITNRKTYLDALQFLEDSKFITIVLKAKNQHQSTVIKICRYNSVKADVTALDTALLQHSNQHCNDTVPIVKPQTIKQQTTNNIPDYSDFLFYALENKPKVDQVLLKMKYESWKVNGWMTGGKTSTKIKNWKSTLLNTLPYIKEAEIKPKTRLNFSGPVI
jgi:hypothetical protein